MGRGRGRELAPYAELLEVLDALPLLVRERRRQLKLTLREAGEAAGVGFNTLYRVESRIGECSLSSAVAILRWLGGTDGG
jgi:hypothetical protein